MKKVKLFPAPHLEIRVVVSDEMIEDYRDCARKASEDLDGKDCDTCSWDDVQFSGTCMCQLEEMKQLLED